MRGDCGAVPRQVLDHDHQAHRSSLGACQGLPFVDGATQLRLEVDCVPLDLDMKDLVRPVEDEVGRTRVVARRYFEPRFPPRVGVIAQRASRCQLAGVTKTRFGARVDPQHQVQPDGIGHRYQGVQLTADLGTDGVLIAGTVRAPKRLSVGTREQLSTLYRLSLGEYLQTVVVLDDQLVQSDQHRMDWFRALLTEKARSFQIVVFTCRPDDYLAAAAMVPAAGPTFVDDEGGLVRAIDLGRAVQRR